MQSTFNGMPFPVRKVIERNDDGLPRYYDYNNGLYIHQTGAGLQLETGKQNHRGKNTYANHSIHSKPYL